jgi:hypothetical protein
MHILTTKVTNKHHLHQFSQVTTVKWSLPLANNRTLFRLTSPYLQGRYGDRPCRTRAGVPGLILACANRLNIVKQYNAYTRRFVFSFILFCFVQVAENHPNTLMH